MKVEHAIEHAKAAKAEGLKGIFPMAAQTLADEVLRLQRIIDSRPAINAGLPETYIEWSQGIYQTDMAQAIGTN